MAVKATYAGRLGRILAPLVAFLVLLGGCAIFEDPEEVQLELDFAAVLPEGWQAIRTWHEVNIDGDGEVEFLLLFQYDNGQIGAVIYDPQSSSDYVGVSQPPDSVITTGTVDIVTAPLQSFGFFRPYRLLPSYWSYTYDGRVGQGVVAMPADANRVGVFVVHDGDHTGSSDRSSQPETEDAAPGEIVLRGGNTHLTFVWWKGMAEGYGVTQLVAPGGFVGIDWPVWEENPEPITRLSGLYPLTDYRGRSLLCREAFFERLPADDEPSRGATETGDQQNDSLAPVSMAVSPIQFSEADMGLRFCDEIPSHPFYPEGVVMAYMAHYQNDIDTALSGEVVDNLLTPGTTAAQVNARLDPARIAQERVVDIETYATIPVSPSTLQSGAFAPTTTVCAELAASGDAMARRWLVFTLKYQPPSLAQRLPDRWTISDIVAAPPPVRQADTDYCRTILETSQE